MWKIWSSRSCKRRCENPSDGSSALSCQQQLAVNGLFVMTPSSCMLPRKKENEKVITFLVSTMSLFPVVIPVVITSTVDNMFKSSLYWYKCFTVSVNVGNIYKHNSRKGHLIHRMYNQC